MSRSKPLAEPAATGANRVAGLPALSVVIPVFNEEQWIERSIDALLVAVANAQWPAEVVVVDDGSTDGTPQRLAQLSEQHGIRVVSQQNQGRFVARQAGIAAATGDQVLLLDSRVIMEPDALRFLRDQFAESPERQVWNGHILMDTEGNPYGGFWSGLVAVAWRRYLANPRLMSFDSTDFDAFPKGTGFFCAPRELLLEAAGAFSSLFSDVRLASDDTRMLRFIAEQQRIHLCPEFAATYHSRDSLKKFVRHAYFRGTTFVDGYLDAPGPVRRAAFAAAGVGALGLGLLLRRPKTFAALTVAGSVSAGVVVRRCGGSSGEARSVAKLLPLFAACFGAGVVRGMKQVVRKRLRK